MSFALYKRPKRFKPLNISTENSIAFTSDIDSQTVETGAAVCAIQRKKFELPTLFNKIFI